MTVLYLYLVVWGVTHWGFSVWASNCTYCVDRCHFSRFLAHLSPPANPTRFPNILSQNHLSPSSGEGFATLSELIFCHIYHPDCVQCSIFSTPLMILKDSKLLQTVKSYLTIPTKIYPDIWEEQFTLISPQRLSRRPPNNNKNKNNKKKLKMIIKNIYRVFF